jgi:hypothetical protein
MGRLISSRRRGLVRAAAVAALALACDVSWGAQQRALAAALSYSPIERPLIAADWQNPAALPRAFRNHCHFDGLGRFYCSNHCGLDYQFYFCTPVSFGCCRPGFGYCDWKGHLRCAPW